MIEINEDLCVNPDMICAIEWRTDNEMFIHMASGKLVLTGEDASYAWKRLSEDAQ